MNGFVKKSFLIYFLFLLTTLNDNPSLATGPLPAKLESVQPVITATAVQQPALPEAQEPEEVKNDIPEVAAKEPPATELEPEPKLAGITPALIEIPAIGEHAEVIEVGLTEDGVMETPSNIYQIGWYAPGTKPGSVGNAVMAGHVDGLTSPGTFYNLKKLEPGDEIHITGTTGKKLTFTVTEKKSYLPEKAPLERIFGPDSEAHLNLITCTGTFNTATGHYEERLVVYADLVEE